MKNIKKLLSMILTVCMVLSVVTQTLMPGTAYADSGNITSIVMAISTVAGTDNSGFSGDNGPAVSARVSPRGVAVDGSGNLYIADYSNNRVRRVDHSTGYISTVAGNGGFGFSGDDGPAVNAELKYPYSVAVDNSGNLFIADNGNNRVRRVDSLTGYISTVAGNNTSGFGGDNGPAVSAQLNYPTGVAVDGSGNLYIADNGNNRIRRVDHSTGNINTVAGTGTLGFSGDNVSAISAQLNHPNGVAVDGNGNLYIADYGNNRIRRVDHSTGNISSVAGDGTQGFSGDDGPAVNARLYSPLGVVVDGSGNLYIADTGNNRIRMVDSSTGKISTVAGNGTNGFSGDNGPPTSAQLNYPNGVAVDGSGNLYIAEWNNCRIRMVAPASYAIASISDQTMTDIAAGYISGTQEARTITVTRTGTGYLENLAAALSGGADSSFEITQPQAATLNIGTPSTVFTVKARDGLAAGTYTETVTVSADSATNVTFTVTQVVTVSPPIISTVAGTGTGGFSGDNGPAASARLMLVHGVAVDGSGNLYIADSDNQRIRRVDHSTGYISTVAGTGTGGFGGDNGPAASAQLNTPFGVAVDGSGNLYITDTYNNRIRRVDHSTGYISTVAGTGTGGFSGDNGPATSARLNYPRGVAVDGSGNLYIADVENNRIRKVDHSTGYISTVAGNASSGFGGDNGPATSARLNGPIGVAVDGSGNLYIADYVNNRIRRVDSSTGYISTVVGTGTQGFSGDNGPADSTWLNHPTEVAVDGSGNLYIADYGNNRIRRVNSSGWISTVAGTGTGGFSGDDGPAANAQLYYPLAVAVDGSGNLYIADSSNGRIRRVAPASYTIASVSDQTMTDITAGYTSGTQETKTITVTRTGTGDLQNLAAAFSGGAGSSFEIPQPPAAALNTGTSSTVFTVKAKDGLAAGTYTETVTVSADSMTNVTFTVTQVVTVVPTVPSTPTITISTQPAALTNVTESSISGSLTVAATVSPSGAPAYEWFSCDDTSHTNPVTTGVTTNTFTIPTTLTAGNYYYYCEVRAAGATPVNSNVATVVVNSAPSGTAPAVISINPISLDLGGTNTATIQVKLGQSGGNPNVLAGKATVTTTGGAISVTPATPADLTADGSITVTGISTGTATVSIGFSGGDVAFGDTKYDRIITVNVTDSSISPPSDAKDVTGVATPGGASISGAAITATVANGVTSQAIALSVSANASWKLYSDAACLNEIIDKTMVLSVGPNAAYVQVTAENGTTKVYTLTITRQEAVPTGNYTVTSSPLTGGTITASPTSATSGSAISLTITPNAGMRLQAGSLKYNDGTTDHPISGTSFTMPAANVIVSAVFEAVPNNTSGGSGGGSSGGGSAASGGTTVTGSVINGATGANVSNITATVTTDSSGNKTVSMPAAQLAIFKQPDGSTSQFSDISKLTITTAAGSTITISSDGTIQVPNLAKGTDNVFKITYDLGNGQTITIGTIDIRTDSSGNVSLTISLIDPYGIIIEAATGKALQGVNVTLYYANTERNKAAGKTPDTVVSLPGIDGFKPNNNKNPQVSDVSGSYGFMVFPVSDYYIVAAKEGYEQYKSPTISVEQDIVKWDFKMNQAIKGVKRLSGLTRIDTALAIAKANYSSKVANVILATADNYPDALAGSVLAYKLNAPILLVDSTNAGQEKVLDYMKSNMDSAGTVYILGGTGAVSSAVEAKVTASGFNHVTRLGGADCYETSVKIAGQLDIKTGTPIVLVSGENYPDALSISSTAAVMQSPILLVQNDGLSDAVKHEITAIKPAKVYIIGLQGVISTSVENQVAQITGLTPTNIVRIGGADRYETSLAVAKYFNLAGQNVCIATGNDFPDALAGSVYAANYNASIILADKTLSDNVTTYLKNRELPGVTILGGEGVVSQNVQQQISELMKR